MNTLFGQPMDTVMRLMLGLFILATGVVALLAARNRVFLKLALRNLPQRRGQTVLIIVGLMLSTVITTTAFATGDTISYSVRLLSVTSLGNVDETVTMRGLFGLPGSFPTALVGRINDTVGGTGGVAGVLGVQTAIAPVVDLSTQQGRTSTVVMGVPPVYPAAFGHLTTVDGQTTAPAALGADGVFLSRRLGQFLNARRGDRLRLYLANTPVLAQVRGVLPPQSIPTAVDLLLPLARLQRLTATPGQLNLVLISNRGDPLAGVPFSDDVTTRLRDALADRGQAAAAAAILRSPGGQAALGQLSRSPQVQTDTATARLLRDLQAQLRLPGESAALVSLLSDNDVQSALESIQAQTIAAPLNRALLGISAYRVSAVKQRAVTAADLAGSVFTTAFLVLGLFSIASGMTLIFLIFVLLAAERRTEMGMARAIGTKRRHLIQQFLFEGYAYDLGAAIAGVGIGILVVVGMIWIVSQLIGHIAIADQSGFSVQLHFEARSLVVAFCLGALATLLTVLVASWRVSRVTIVSAIRDLPDDTRKAGRIGDAFRRPLLDLRRAATRLRRGRLIGALTSLCIAPWHLITAPRVLISRGIPLLVIAPLLVWAGIAGQQLWPFNIGISSGLIGLAMALRWLLALLGVRERLRDRAGYSLAGALLVLFWVQPFDAFRTDLHFDIEMFFISGMLLMLGGIWVVIYNIDVLIGGLVRLAGHGLRFSSSLAPVVKIAVAYPLQHRFRTGLVLFMFGLVIFSLVVASVVAASFGGEHLDLARGASGFDAWGSASRSDPIENIASRIAANPTLRARVAAVGGIGELRVDLRQSPESTGAWSTRFEVAVADDGYLAGTRMPLRQRAVGIGSDAQAWQLLRTHPGDALVSSSFLATAQTAPGDFVLQGVRDNGRPFPPVQLQMRDRTSGAVVPLTVIGVLDDRNVNMLVGYDLYTGRQTLTTRQVAAPPIDTFFFRARSGQDAHQMVLALGTAFLANGLDLTEARVVWGQVSAAVTGFGNLLEGFMALGLLVGIAALGVIATRSVVERRQQVGMLRALGFTRAMVRRSFLLESCFIAVLGTALGTVLGALLARQVVLYLAESSRGLALIIPWAEIALIVLAATAASLLTTYLPARQAARIFPAEALRYE